VVAPEALDAALLEAREAALGAARAMRAGRIRPCPARCSPNGCAYPGICRAAEEPPEEPGAPSPAIAEGGGAA
jgi:hypothetical protein